MTLMNTLLARHSTRKFTGEKIPRTQIEKIARAGLTGPVGRNKKPWKLVAVDDAETIKKLSAARTPRQGIFDTTTAVIAVFGNLEIADTWIEDCSVVMTNMHLMANDLGLGSCWIQGRGRLTESGQSSSDYVRDVLGVSADWELLAMLAIGVLDKSAPTRERAESDIDMAPFSWN